MRKLTIAVAIFIVLIAFAIFEFKYVSNKCTQILNSTSQIKNLIASNDFKNAKKQLKPLLGAYLNDEKSLQMLLQHDNLDDIHMNFNQLESDLDLENKNHAIKKILKINSSCEKILNNTVPKIQNLL